MHILICVVCITAMPNIVAGDVTAPERGVYEVVLVSESPLADPWTDDEPRVTFTRPDASSVSVDGFYDGSDDGKPVFKARAYCNQAGEWSWKVSSGIEDLVGRSGTFNVAPSTLPGKLRKHPKDQYQFAHDNADWFLHIGDTGYRYVVDSEPEWRNYIDQAAKMGATKIRTWFCRSRSGVEALFTADRSSLNLAYWQEIDMRVQYALNKYPHVILQLIPYGEDAEELWRYGRGDRMSKLIAQYAQARFSAFPNVLWCISNDQKIVGELDAQSPQTVPSSLIDRIGRDMAAREPWGTLLTNHQTRRTGYAFTSASWSDIVTLQDLDQVNGKIILEYREKADSPVVNEEDRYELHETPAHPRYYFRRLMWSSLLSGGSATYGGARTYEPYNGRNCGVRGYYDLNKEGVLRSGADDFIHIHKFFNDSGLTLVGMRPEDTMVAGDPGAVKVVANDCAVIAYIANPDSKMPKQADAADVNACCTIRLPSGKYSIHWFNPQTGEWLEEGVSEASGDYASFTAPFAGDAVLAIKAL